MRRDEELARREGSLEENGRRLDGVTGEGRGEGENEGENGRRKGRRGERRGEREKRRK